MECQNSRTATLPNLGVDICIFEINDQNFLKQWVNFPAEFIKLKLSECFIFVSPLFHCPFFCFMYLHNL